MSYRLGSAVRIAAGLVLSAVLLVAIGLTPDAQPEATAQDQPEAELNMEGFAFPGNKAHQPVKGLFQSHNHHWSYKGFGQGPFCGKTFDPGGITEAMVDCPEHKPWGIPAWLEQIVTGQAPFTPHSTQGWPKFKDWPRPDTAFHNTTYYKGIERAWRSGVRMYVDHLVSNRALCLIYAPTRASCDEMDAVRAQAEEARAFEKFLDDQYGGPGEGWYRIVESPEHAREVIADGKLAVVLGVEVSEPFGCTKSLGTPQCTEEDIDRGLDEVYDLGVRSLFLCHKFDNALCGVRFDGGTNGTILNIGNLITTGQFWQAETCTGEHHDNTIAPADDGILNWLWSVIGPIVDPVTLPIYPPAPHCNVNGLTDLGEHALEGMMDRGMIVELDHQGVKSADQTLDVLEAHDYSGVISGHDWMDEGYMSRVAALGGMTVPIVLGHGHTADKWRKAKSVADERYEFGMGFGLDQNGLHLTLPAPGESPEISYPFTSYDGKATLDKQVWGERVWDLNKDGLAHEGMTPDWLEAARLEAGPDSAEFVADMTNGAEAYLQMWERAVG